MKQKDQSGCRRAFHWSSKAWYNKDGRLNEISFGMYAYEGGTSGEMVMRWHNLYGNTPSPRLESFYDSWFDLYQFRDVLNNLAATDGKAITEQEFVNILLSCGFEDITAYENPRGMPQSDLERELALHESRANAIRKKLTQ